MIHSPGDADDDIAEVLRRWPFIQGEVQVRFLDGIGDVRKIQVRLEGGILQFNTAGRPDGARPNGAESWLDLWRQRTDALSQDDCETLRLEIQLYHQRAAAYLLMEEFAAVIADCQHNLDAIDLALDRAQSTVDRAVFGTARIGCVLLRTRAEASIHIRLRDTQGALAAIDRGLANLHGGAQVGMRSLDGDSAEAAMLRAMRDALIPKLPSSQRVDLESRLKHALRMENYELAAILRNELRQIGY